MTSSNSAAEQLLEAYLVERGLRFEREPLIGGRRPDFVVAGPTGQVAMEVFEPGFQIPAGGGGFDSVEPITKAFKGRKSKQTQAARNAGLPAIVVIGSTKAPIPYSMFSLEGAMFGRAGVAISLDDEDAEARPGRLGGAKVQPTCGTSVSAMALLQRFRPTDAVVQEAWRRTGAVPEPGEVRPKEQLIADIKRQRQIEEDLAEAGAHDPGRWVERLVIAHNLYAAHRLLRAFAGPYDEQYDAVIMEPGVGSWEHVASGRLANQVVLTV